jgi:hypothetical protein
MARCPNRGRHRDDFQSRAQGLLAAATAERYNRSRFHQQKYCHPKWLNLPPDGLKSAR